MPTDRRASPESMFRDQVSTLVVWFDHWTETEQSVALVALFKRIRPAQARFLVQCLQRDLSDCSTEARRLEVLANDPIFVASLAANSENDFPTIPDIQTYLPLLTPKNLDARSVYVNFITKILKHAVDTNAQYEEARQLLSYALIHPAFGLEERATMFKSWMNQHEENTPVKPTGDVLTTIPNFPPPPRSSPPTIIDFSNWQPPNSMCNNPATSTGNTNNQSNNLGSSSVAQGLLLGSYGGTAAANFHRIRRSNSLTPPVLHSDAWNSQEELCSSSKPRSLSLSSEIAPPSSGLGSGSGSGSESHLDDPRPSFIAPGMRDVPSWLKSLRLHKYAFLFAHLSFEEMMSLSEMKLEAQGVTKGARHKIILSIAKLKERSAHLRKVFEEMTGEKESIRNALNEVKWTLTTPMKPVLLAPPGGGGGGNNDQLGHGHSGRDTSPRPSYGKNVGDNNRKGGNGMAPIGTNRFQEEGSSSGRNRQDLNLPGPSSSTSPTRMGNDTDGDLSGWIVRTVGKACELNQDVECEGLLISVLDKCLAHDGFTLKQKRLMSLWRQQQTPIARRNSSGGSGHQHHPHFHHQQRNLSGSLPGSNSSKNNNRNFSPRVLNLGTQLGGLGIGPTSWAPGNSIHAMFMAKRPSLQDAILESTRTSHMSVQRTKSAPLPNFFTAPPLPLSSSPPPLNLGSLFDRISYEQANSFLTGTVNPMAGLDMNMRSSPPNPNMSSGSGNNFMYNTCSMSSNSGMGSGMLGAGGGTGVGTNITHSMGGTNSPSVTSSSCAMDITARLESLCLSMTEAALGSAFNI